jgi:hypothetical protein
MYTESVHPTLPDDLCLWWQMADKCVMKVFLASFLELITNVSERLPGQSIDACLPEQTQRPNSILLNLPLQWKLY